MEAELSPKKKAIKSLSEPQNTILKLGESTEGQLSPWDSPTIPSPLPYFTVIVSVLNYKLLRDHKAWKRA